MDILVSNSEDNAFGYLIHIGLQFCVAVSLDVPLIR